MSQVSFSCESGIESTIHNMLRPLYQASGASHSSSTQNRLIAYSISCCFLNLTDESSRDQNEINLSAYQLPLKRHLATFDSSCVNDLHYRSKQTDVFNTDSEIRHHTISCFYLRSRIHWFRARQLNKKKTFHTA